MVGLDIDRGAELLGALERAKLKVGVALWVYLSEYDDWRLVVSARRLDSLDLRDAYRLLHDSLAAAGFTPKNTPSVMILPMSDPFIRELRRLFGKTRSVEGMRLGGQVIGDRFVQDAYVYRIS
ncbi:MAG: hypothetical protein ABSF25_05705 [Bryobacteraceae bacterium]|jgi:hypothetical protein